MSSGCLRLSHADAYDVACLRQLNPQSSSERWTQDRKESSMKQRKWPSMLVSPQSNRVKPKPLKVRLLICELVLRTGATLPAELEFIDNGYSGATLIRPALERLRDVAAAGGIDQLYVHCPDRLARNYAHQVLLLGRVSASRSRGRSFSTEKSDRRRKISSCCRSRA